MVQEREMVRWRKLWPTLVEIGLLLVGLSVFAMMIIGVVCLLSALLGP